MYHFLSAPGGSEQICVVCEIIRMCTFLKYHIKMYKDHVFDDCGEISIGIWRVSFFDHTEMCTFLTFCTHFWRFSWNPYRYLTSMIFVRIVKINVFWTIWCVTSFFPAIIRNCLDIQKLIDFIRKSHSYWFSVWDFENSGKSMKIKDFFWTSEMSSSLVV